MATAVYDVVCARLHQAGLNNPIFEHRDPQRFPSWSRAAWGQRPKPAGYPMGLVCGSHADESGLLVIDVDCKKGVDGFDALAELESKYGELPKTLQLTSRGGSGCHLYFRGAGYRTQSGLLGVGVDVRGEGGFVYLGSAIELDAPIAELPPTWAAAIPKSRAMAEPADVAFTRHAGPEVHARVSAVAKGRSGLIWQAVRDICAGDRFVRAAGGTEGLAVDSVDEFLRNILWTLASEDSLRTIDPRDMNALFAASMGILAADDRAAGNDVYDRDAIARKWESAARKAEGEAKAMAGVRAYLEKRRTNDSEPEALVQWKAGLALTDKGVAANTLDNALIALECAPELVGKLEYNLRAGKIEWCGNPPWCREGWEAEVRDTDYDELHLWLASEGVRISTPILQRAVAVVAERHKVDRWREYLEGLEWDGTRRLDLWLQDYCGAEDSAYVRAVGAKWLISAAARSLDPGCQVDTMLIVEGDQGIKKTSLLRTLVGGLTYYGSLSADVATKDAILSIHGPVIVEWSELQALKGKDARAVKHFLTLRADVVRRPYARNAETLKRTCVFAGTTNDLEYLRDWTGARRFWPVACTHIDIERVEADKNQLWAEAVHRYRAGEPWWLDEETVRDQQSEADARRESDVDVWADRLREWLDSPMYMGDRDVYEFGPRRFPLAATMVSEGRVAEIRATDLLEALDVGVEKCGHGAMRSALDQAMRILGWSSHVRSRRYRVDRLRADGSRIQGVGYRRPL